MQDKIEMTDQQKALIQNWKYDKDARTLRHIETWNAAIEAASIKISEMKSRDIQDDIRDLKLINEIRKLKI